MRRVSVIVRFKNEARFLEATLRAVRAQRIRVPVELVCADNRSTDGSRVIAQAWADQVVDIEDYRPGRALNRIIEHCSGDVLVALSAHAVPATERWLTDLVAHLANPHVLGVYGAQHYPSTSRFLDKRDLDIFSDSCPRSETVDSDFWNANSTFYRSRWEELPFDEDIIELEDHHWTKRLLARAGPARFVRYEPLAPVYHHGHEQRNDRTFLAPSPMSSTERIDWAVGVLSAPGAEWSAAMTAGMTVGSLAGEPAIDRAVPALASYLLDDADFDVRWRMAGALGRLGCPDAVPALILGLSDPSFYVRDECAWALARLGTLATAAVLGALPRLDEAFRPFAALALGVSADQAAPALAVDAFAALLCASSAEVERDAVYFLGEVGRLHHRQHLLSAVRDRISCDDPRMARAAVWSWGSLAESRDDTAGHQLVAHIVRAHPVDLVRAEAVTALRRAEGSLWRCADALRDGAGVVRHAAMQALRLGQAPTEVMAAHPPDRDFGVELERSLALGEPVRI